MLDTNLTSTFLTVRACMPIMRAQGSGRIVLISSITGTLTGYPGLAHYAATKAGMLGFIRARPRSSSRRIRSRSTRSSPAASAPRAWPSSARTRSRRWRGTSRSVPRAIPTTSRLRQCSSPATPPATSPAKPWSWMAGRRCPSSRFESDGLIDIEQLTALSADGEVETVTLCAMPDLLGRLVGKRVTVNTFLKTASPESEGLHASLILFTYDMELEARDGFALTGWHDGFRDCRMVPDLSTLRIAPWLAAHRDRDLRPRRRGDRRGGGGLPPRHPQAASSTLPSGRDVAAMCDRAGVLPVCRQLPRRVGAPLPGAHPGVLLPVGLPDLPVEQGRAVHGPASRAMDVAGIEVEFSKSEYGLGQQELNLRYAAALEMADRHVLYKTAVKEMAAQDGLAACFMAKPRIDEIGSSCHVHLSVWDQAGTRSLMADDNGTGVSDLCQHFIAGQAPTVET